MQPLPFLRFRVDIFILFRFLRKVKVLAGETGCNVEMKKLAFFVKWVGISFGAAVLRNAIRNDPKFEGENEYALQNERNLFFRHRSGN